MVQAGTKLPGCKCVMIQAGTKLPECECVMEQAGRQASSYPGDNVWRSDTGKQVLSYRVWMSFGARKQATNLLNAKVLRTNCCFWFFSPARSKQCRLNKVRPICGTNHKQVRRLLKAIHLCQQLWDNSVHHPTWIATFTPVWCQRIQLIEEDYAWRSSLCSAEH